MKYPRFVRENSPCIILLTSCFLTYSILPSDSVRLISASANPPEHLKISSTPLTVTIDFISILSEIHVKSLTIF